MFKSQRYRALELFVLFVLFPVSLVLQWPMETKLTLGALAFLYVILITVMVDNFSFSKISKSKWRPFIIGTAIKFSVIALLLSIYVFVTTPEKLYYVVIEKPKVWLFFLAVYTLVSVIPQELVYRTFFFKRYELLFKNKNLFILINAGLFSLGHLFFGNTLVMFITFIGGLLFAFTYSKTKSTLFVLIEHTLYGCWLYTVGMGEMLGFPA
jgi:membrane protease YdiL (CAAX protease family)